jgi:hypothetical protein
MRLDKGRQDEAEDENRGVEPERIGVYRATGLNASCLFIKLRVSDELGGQVSPNRLLKNALKQADSGPDGGSLPQCSTPGLRDASERCRRDLVHTHIPTRACDQQLVGAQALRSVAQLRDHPRLEPARRRRNRGQLQSRQYVRRVSRVPHATRLPVPPVLRRGVVSRRRPSSAHQHPSSLLTA